MITPSTKLNAYNKDSIGVERTNQSLSFGFSSVRVAAAPPQNEIRSTWKPMLTKIASSEVPQKLSSLVSILLDDSHVSDIQARR